MSALESGSESTIGQSLWEVAAIVTERGNGEEAARLFGAADRFIDSGDVWTVEAALIAGVDRSWEAVRMELGEGVFATAWEAGRAMTGEQAKIYALRQL